MTIKKGLDLLKDPTLKEQYPNIGASDLQHDFRCPSGDARKFLPGSQPYESRAGASPTFMVGVCDMSLVIPHRLREEPIES